MEVNVLMNLEWTKNEIICKELYAPFDLEKDCDYFNDLKEKFNIVIKQIENAGADLDCIKILNTYKNRILDALTSYYQADIAKCNIIIENLIHEVGDNPFAVSILSESYAFPENFRDEIQFFRCRRGNQSNVYLAKDMLHLPQKLRAKSGNYRFSIPGNPSLYLANSSYGCWIETDFPADNEFNVSPVLVDGTQKILNLAVSIKNCCDLKDFDEEMVKCWLRLYMLTIATSYRIKEEGRIFKSEYIISQSIMMACKRLGYDGIAYYSKRVKNEAFASCAINLVLFVDYEGEYSKIVRHMKMDDAFNFGFYKQLCPSLIYKDYNLKSIGTGNITNIGNYDRQYPYNETKFFEFDKFLFASWQDKHNKKGKNEIPWGVPVD